MGYTNVESWPTEFGFRVPTLNSDLVGKEVSIAPFIDLLKFAEFLNYCNNCDPESMLPKNENVTEEFCRAHKPK